MQSISKILVVIAVLLSSINSYPQNDTKAQKTVQLKTVIDGYFSVKDALVKTDMATASAKAIELLNIIKTVEMKKLSTEEHTVWMKVFKDLSANTEKIRLSNNIAKQRAAFALLSKNMYDLAKVSKDDVIVYYQHCPMYNKGKGAHWLSKDEVIKNPYYGSQMLTCGSLKETISL